MKYVFTLFFILAAFLKTNASINSSQPNDSVEVLLSIKNNDKAIYMKMKNIFESMPGVIYVSYCENHAIFALYVNKNLYPVKNDFLEKLDKLAELNAPLLSIKKGSFTELFKNCNTSNPEDAQLMKGN